MIGSPTPLAVLKIVDMKNKCLLDKASQGNVKDKNNTVTNHALVDQLIANLIPGQAGAAVTTMEINPGREE